MRMSTADDVGHVVRGARQERGWTQAHLAQEAGVSRDLVSRLEGGSRRVELGKVFDVLAALELIATVQARPAQVDLSAILRAHTGARP